MKSILLVWIGEPAVVPTCWGCHCWCLAPSISASRRLPPSIWVRNIIHWQEILFNDIFLNLFFYLMIRHENPSYSPSPGFGVEAVELGDLAGWLLHEGRAGLGEGELDPSHQIKLQLEHLRLLQPLARLQHPDFLSPSRYPDTDRSVILNTLLFTSKIQQETCVKENNNIPQMLLYNTAKSMHLSLLPRAKHLLSPKNPKMPG